MEPKKLIEALEEEGWIIAMQEELNQFERNKGYNQHKEIDYEETFSPVARIEAIMIFLAYVAYMGFMVYQMDVKSAFLNVKISNEVYVQQPPGFESSEFPNHVYKLDKALYGLKQAPRAWYLKGTPNLSLWYPKGSGFNLKAYSDLDYIGCNMDRKSTLGGCQILRGKLGCWSEKKQSSMAVSSAEAEYVAVGGCCAQVLRIKSQMADYDVLYDKMSIFCNNTSVIAISNNPVLHSRTKHINIWYHFIRDYILKGDIELHFIPTNLQLADILTKPLVEPSLTRLVAELGTSEWFKKDYIGLVTSWEELVEKFVQKFYQLSDHDEEIKAEEDDDSDDITDIFKIEGNLFDYETTLCNGFNDFNYLLKIDTDLFTFNIQGIGTYEEYELNNTVTRDLEEPWSDNGYHINYYDELADGKLKEETLMHKEKVEESWGNATPGVMKLCAWLINSFGNFHELDYNVLVNLQECWWKINTHDVALFTRLENYGQRPYANFKTKNAHDPYLEINNIFGRNYDTSNADMVVDQWYFMVENGGDMVNKTDGEAMINSIKNGDQPLPRVTQVSIAGTTLTKQPPLKDKSMWSDQEKRVQNIDRLARSLLIQGLLKDIYSLIDSNKTAKDI
uniref:Retrovirus-related Pol polyprotein from transposon TNT 1-94 n=1 Tax=Tanacetum cinerariifolium TaxID=118510 RepID=A0A6L2JSK5_TANCI|nr:retrovirus-related Pol polyprotein from transposon TNT 1-94 [Tanacetum cinerariifolium]